MACELAAILAQRGTQVDYISWLPHLNASLNGLSAVLLLLARRQIKAKQVEAHRRTMLAALAVSALFLVSYIAYHYGAPIFRFRGQGWIRPVYYTLLISHVTLAAMSLPLIAMTAARGLWQRVASHRALARWTWPMWMYVSASGLAVYLLLYYWA